MNNRGRGTIPATPPALFFPQPVALSNLISAITHSISLSSEMPLNFDFTDGRRDVPSARFKSHAVTTFCRSAFERAVASESTFPTKSSSVPLARLKSPAIGLLRRVALEACQRHAATFRAENNMKSGFCNSPGHIQGEKSYKVDAGSSQTCQRHVPTLRCCQLLN